MKEISDNLSHSSTQYAPIACFPILALDTAQVQLMPDDALQWQLTLDLPTAAAMCSTVGIGLCVRSFRLFSPAPGPATSARQQAPVFYGFWGPEIQLFRVLSERNKMCTS